MLYPHEEFASTLAGFCPLGLATSLLFRLPIIRETLLHCSIPHARKAVCVLCVHTHFVRVSPRGIEPRSQPSEGCALSVELRGQGVDPAAVGMNCFIPTPHFSECICRRHNER